MNLTRTAAATLSVMLLAGCTSGDDDTPPDPVAETPEEDEDPSQDDPEETANGSAETDDPTDSNADDADDTDDTDDGASRNLQGTVEVEREASHVSGVIVEVTQVTAEGNAVYIDIEAFNGSEREIRLIESAPTHIMLLADETRLPFRPADDNPELEIPSGGELTATLAFAGRLPTSTTTLDLLLNWGELGPLDLDRPRAAWPSFEFRDLPLPDDR